MFTLRMLDNDGQINWYLGNSYSYTGRTENPKDFKRTYKNHFEKDHVADLDKTADDNSKDCVGFITSGESGVISIFKNREHRYYVMSANGQTFANLTCI